MVPHSLWGTNPVGDQVQSLLWHVVAATALYSVFLRLIIAPAIADIAAPVFAVHPQRVESSVWTNRPDNTTMPPWYCHFSVQWMDMMPPASSAYARCTYLSFSRTYFLLRYQTVTISPGANSVVTG
jgi:hypothetical protein